jgi:transposase
LPKVKPIVTEHRQHTVECPQCHTLVKAAAATVPQEVFGPRATALAGALHGRWRLSVRETSTVLGVVCGLPVSAGGVAGLCHDTSQALAKPQAEIAEQVRAASVVNVDETSWRQAGSRPWLWVMRAARATLFRVLGRRNAEALRELVGTAYRGTVISDRHRAYNCLAVERRQVCWSHLKRDFQSFADWGGATGAWGKRLLVVEAAVFREWHRFRAGQLDRVGLLLALAPLQAQLHSWLEAGRQLAVAAGFCEDLLKVWSALWTFAERGGVEPTNNEAERALRPAVLWRKGCFGAFSDWGNQFVERILSVSATCRQQGLDLLDTLTAAVVAWRTTAPQPA